MKDILEINGLVNEAVQYYSFMIEQLREQLEDELGGTLLTDLIDELPTEKPYIKLEDELGRGAYVRILTDGNIEAEVDTTEVCNDHGEGRIELYWKAEDIILSAELERALRTARLTAVSLEAMASTIREVV